MAGFLILLDFLKEAYQVQTGKINYSDVTVGRLKNKIDSRQTSK